MPPSTDLDEATAEIAVEKGAVLVLLHSTDSSENGGGSAVLRIAALGRSELLCRFTLLQQHF